VGPGAGLDRCGKSRPSGIRSSDLPARSVVAILTAIPAPGWTQLILNNVYVQDILCSVAQRLV
jgi:hypothetical protein